MIKTEEFHLCPERLDGPVVSELLLGINLELSPITTPALLSNRIRNSKFASPADPQTGVAPEWMPFGNNMGGMHARTVEGMFMSPSQSQMIHNYSGPYGGGIVQAGICVKKGEVLEFKIWAKVRHAPVRIKVSLRAQPSRDEDGYANAEMVIDTAYWQCFQARMPITETDENAILFIFLMEPGVILIDQVSLEPEGSSGLDLDTQEAILRLNPPAIRFPGGCMSTNHHWRMGTGPRELRPSLADPVFKLRVEYDFGTDEYLELCRLLGNAPHITVNVGSGTPQDAAAWAAYCQEWYSSRSIEPPLAYFQIGNEQYGPWESSHMTAAMYADALRKFVPGIRHAYPNCRIIALAEPVATGIAGAADTPFRQEVLSAGRDLVDILAINRYKGQWYHDPAEQLQNAIDSVGKIRHDLEVLAEEAREAGWSSPRIAVTEWNYWLHAAHWDGKDFHEPDDALHGVFFSGVIHALFRMADTVEIASFYQMLNAMGVINKTKGHVHETAVGTLFRLYRSALPGRLVSLNDAQFETQDLDCVAIAREGGLSLFLSHRAMQDSLPLTLDESFGEVESCQSLAAADCYTAMKTKPIAVQDGRIILPPLSVTKIEFSPRAN